jgi:hypothetical protein
LAPKDQGQGGDLPEGKSPWANQFEAGHRKRRMAQLETGATRRWKDLFAVYFIALGAAFTLAWFACRPHGDVHSSTSGSTTDSSG